MHFALRLTDGTVVDNSFDNEPFTFVMGDETLDKGLELALFGLKPGDRQILTLMPGQAFGVRDESALQWLPMDRFPPDIVLEQGQIIGFSGENGEEVAAAIIEIQGQQVRVDFNHPLTGREIEFEVQVLDVKTT